MEDLVLVSSLGELRASSYPPSKTGDNHAPDLKSHCSHHRISRTLTLANRDELRCPRPGGRCRFRGNERFAVELQLRCTVVYDWDAADEQQLRGRQPNRMDCDRYGNGRVRRTKWLHVLRQDDQRIYP